MIRPSAWFDRLNPVTRRRLKRFARKRRALAALVILTALYALSLGSELLCNDRPLYIRHNGRSYFPVFRFYPESTFLPTGRQTRTDYKQLARSPVFAEGSGNILIFPPVPYGPNETISPQSLRDDDRVTAVFTPMPRVASLNVRDDLTISRSMAAGVFFNLNDADTEGMPLSDLLPLRDDLREAIASRFANQPSDGLNVVIPLASGRRLEAGLSAFEPRPRPPRTVRISLRENETAAVSVQTAVFTHSGLKQSCALLDQLDDDQRQQVIASAGRSFEGVVEPLRLTRGDTVFTVAFERNDIQWPYPPTRGHWLGIDSAGRDVLARILYGLRISLTFGILLVGTSMAIGILIGGIQGYFGGRTDITAQRLIEIWSALPFLYVMILLGSVYGRSFMLLLFCYGIFNWIGISYYMRAEFLRLRRQPFVDAARCLGLPTHRIMARHILPNALTPIVTLFPFALVGAISALAGLDYLGFGLPPPTPSWGQMLQQAQQFRWAWWLILYPSAALFTVMLLGVFIGEGIRDAYDPKPFSSLE